MKKFLNGKGPGFYAELLSIAVAAVALIVYLIYNLTIHKFTIDVFLMILVGIVVAVVSLVTNFRFASVLSVLSISLAIGFYLNDRIIMFEEMINGITGMTERDNIFGVVILIFVLLFISAILGIVASFNERERAE